MESDVAPPTDAWSRRITESSSAYHLPGLAVAVAHGHEVVWARGFGYADIDSGRPVRPDTVFRIASISKVFTAVGIMVLAEEARLDLDDPVVAHVPELPDDAITIRDLLCHGSGLERETPGDRGWQTGEFLFGDDFLASARVRRGVLRPPRGLQVLEPRLQRPRRGHLEGHGRLL